MRFYFRSLNLLLLALCMVGTSASVAAVIKNVQTGVATMPGGSTIATVTITSVNTARTFVICNILIDSNNGNGAVADEYATCELTNSTTLTITNGDVDPFEMVRWYVVEFLSGVTVQRSPPGGTPLAAGALAPQTVNVGIAPVNLAQAFVLIGARNGGGPTGAFNIDEQFTPTAQLTLTTNLQLMRNETATALAVAWQVVQIESAAVQSGTATIARSGTSVTATLNPAVDTTRTFLVFTSDGGSAVNGVESRYLTRGEITDATTLTFTRARRRNAANGQVNIAWFAVRMTDGTTVQSGTTTNTPDPNTMTMNAALSPPVVISRSVPIISVSGDPLNTVETDALDDNSWAAQLTSPTNLQLTNSTNVQNAWNTTVAWQVVQFANAPNRVDGDGREIFP